MQRGRLPRADVHDGHDPALRLGRSEGALPAPDRLGRAATTGIWRHGAGGRLRHDVDPDDGDQGRRRLALARPEDLDVACALLRPDAPAGADDACRRGREEDARPVHLHRRHEAGGHGRHDDDPTDQDADEPRDDGDLPRRRLRRGRRPRRRAGPGLPLHPRRHERRARAHRGRVHRRRPLVRREGVGIRVRARRLREADRRKPGSAVPDRPGVRPDRGGRSDALQGGLAVRAGAAVWRGGEHGQAARG